jgi:GTP-binding protein
LDASGSEGRDPIEDFYMINQELSQYNERLMDKPQIIAANKTDIPGSEDWIAKIKEEFEPQGIAVYEISAASQTGIRELLYGVWNLLENTEIIYETYDELLVDEIEDINDEIIVRKDEDDYIVEGGFMERLLQSTYMDDNESLKYFQEMLRKKGIVDELKALGITEGESVFICGYEFEFYE